MTSSREELKKAVHEILNDVIEQGFHHLVSHPQQSDELNRIIKDATDELNYQVLKIDSHSFSAGSPQLLEHYKSISQDTQRKSLELLSRLQKIQQLENPRLKRL
jgi:arsenate reductase-like glutaredoxin family protein